MRLQQVVSPKPEREEWHKDKPFVLSTDATNLKELRGAVGINNVQLKKKELGIIESAVHGFGSTHVGD